MDEKFRATAIWSTPYPHGQGVEDVTLHAFRANAPAPLVFVGVSAEFTHADGDRQREEASFYADAETCSHLAALFYAAAERLRAEPVR